MEGRTMTKTETYVTLPRLAGRLGLQYYQVQYFVRTGRIPDGTARGESTRKTWTEAEADTIEKWYRDYRRLDAGCCAERERGEDGHGVAP
jgi:hypothetical protein